jgi:hypothetical protein
VLPEGLGELKEIHSPYRRRGGGARPGGGGGAPSACMAGVRKWNGMGVVGDV